MFTVELLDGKYNRNVASNQLHHLAVARECYRKLQYWLKIDADNNEKTVNNSAMANYKHAAAPDGNKTIGNISNDLPIITPVGSKEDYEIKEERSGTSYKVAATFLPETPAPTQEKQCACCMFMLQNGYYNCSKCGESSCQQCTKHYRSCNCKKLICAFCNIVCKKEINNAVSNLYADGSNQELYPIIDETCICCRTAVPCLHEVCFICEQRCCAKCHTTFCRMGLLQPVCNNCQVTHVSQYEREMKEIYLQQFETHTDKDGRASESDDDSDSTMGDVDKDNYKTEERK